MPKSMFSDAYRAMLDVIIAVRREKGLTQEAVASKIGKPQSFIAKIEGGERRLDVIELVAIAGAMDIEPTKLFEAVMSRLPKQVLI
jgi:transcriptional regulator with XRE-family HTH domain